MIARCMFLVIFAFFSIDVADARASLSQDLESRVVKLFDEMDSLPVTMSRDGGNIQVRTRQSGDHMITFSEAKETNLHPDRFKMFLQRFQQEFPKVNTMVQSVKSLEVDRRNGGREGVKSVLKFPFPLSDRVMIHWKYLRLGRQPNEHMLYLSEEANEELLARYHTTAEKKKYVLGRTFLCAYWIRPRYDNKGNVTGSKIQYLFSGDTGGSVPTKVQNLMGPKAALESVQELIKHVEKN